MDVADLPPHRGWFAVAFSRELRGGHVLTRRVNGRELVVFRTASGAVAALDPICPHLGAHLGVGGEVRGETVRCPFHGFRFDAAGRCTHTGYGTEPPAGLAVGSHATIERTGAVLVWSDPDGGEPGWEPPMADEAGWSSWRTRLIELPGHPVETNENAADAGHLAVVHGYRSLETVAPLTADGPTLRATYAMQRPFRAGGRLGIRTRFDIASYGLGYSLVDVTIPTLHLRTRHLVLATPTDRGRLALRIGLSARVPIAGRLGAALSELVAFAAIGPFAHDVHQDVPIWSSKQHLERPRLARGDGPIGRYRTWARQFAADAAA